MLALACSVSYSVSMSEVPKNVETNLLPEERDTLASELQVAELLDDAKYQILAIASLLGELGTVSDDYQALTYTPDLARTIRVANSLGATVKIIVTHPVEGC